MTKEEKPLKFPSVEMTSVRPPKGEAIYLVRDRSGEVLAFRDDHLNGEINKEAEIAAKNRKGSQSISGPVTDALLKTYDLIDDDGNVKDLAADLPKSWKFETLRLFEEAVERELIQRFVRIKKNGKTASSFGSHRITVHSVAPYGLIHIDHASAAKRLCYLPPELQAHLSEVRGAKPWSRISEYVTHLAETARIAEEIARSRGGKRGKSATTAKETIAVPLVIDGTVFSHHIQEFETYSALLRGDTPLVLNRPEGYHLRSVKPPKGQSIDIPVLVLLGETELLWTEPMIIRGKSVFQEAKGSAPAAIQLRKEWGEIISPEDLEARLASGANLLKIDTIHTEATGTFHVVYKKMAEDNVAEIIATTKGLKDALVAMAKDEAAESMDLATLFYDVTDRANSEWSPEKPIFNPDYVVAQVRRVIGSGEEGYEEVREASKLYSNSVKRVAKSAGQGMTIPGLSDARIIAARARLIVDLNCRVGSAPFTDAVKTFRARSEAERCAILKEVARPENREQLTSATTTPPITWAKRLFETPPSDKDAHAKIIADLNGLDTSVLERVAAIVRPLEDENTWCQAASKILKVRVSGGAEPIRAKKTPHQTKDKTGKPGVSA